LPRFAGETSPVSATNAYTPSATFCGLSSSPARAGQAASNASGSARSAIVASHAAMVRIEIMCKQTLIKALTVIETRSAGKGKWILV
jgi:hypothetical protein